MIGSLDVLFTPAEFNALPARDLGNTVCVVFDVLRATSTMVTALGNGAEAIIPVGEINDALQWRKRQPDVLLAGEREGLRITAAQSGGTGFDLGNSPRKFTRERVTGKTIVMTTTNGTRALRACVHARSVLVSSFLNLGATAAWLRREAPENLLLICAGTVDQAAYEDTLAAGALAETLWQDCTATRISDSALMARRIFSGEQVELAEALVRGRNGRRLAEIPELVKDIPYCSQRDVTPVVAAMDAGQVRKIQ